MILEYNDYWVSRRSHQTPRKTNKNYYTGIGLAIMIYLVLTIMQLGEKRANLASLNAEKENLSKRSKILSSNKTI